MARELIVGLSNIAASARTPCRLEISSSVEDVPLLMSVEAAILGATHEAIRNVDRHANASLVTVTVSWAEGELSVHIEDDGCGFDPDSHRGFGLSQSVFGRMNEVGGTARVTSAPGNGTRATLRWMDSAHLGTLSDVDEYMPALRRSLIFGTALVLLGGHLFGTIQSLSDVSNPVVLMGAVIGCVLATPLTIRMYRAWPDQTPAILAVILPLAVMVMLWAGGAQRFGVLDLYTVSIAASPLIVISYLGAPPGSQVFGLLTLLAALVLARPTANLLDAPLVLLPTTVSIVAASLGSILMRQLGQRSDQLRRQRADSYAAEQRRTAQLAEHQSRSDRFADDVVPFLEDIVSGRLSPATDSEVRAKALRLANAVRDELWLPGVLQRPAREALDHARREGRSVTVRLTDPNVAVSPGEFDNVLIKVLSEHDASRSISVDIDPISGRLHVSPSL